MNATIHIRSLFSSFMTRRQRAAAVLSILIGFCLTIVSAQQIPSKTTYSKAYGATRHEVTVDAARELPRYPAVEPKDALATWQIKKGFRLELAACEPQVRDPIALCFDERGRMFVCEMIDYSEMRDSTPHLGRVSLLEDRDGDGFYETSQVFADDLPWPTGLIWANGGLYVGATPDIWRFEDRNGDGRAEVREKIFTGFGTGLKMLNVQGLMNSFQWGADNRIHVQAGGGNRGVITCPTRPELPGLELGGRDFWFDSLTHQFGLENGGAQYGMSFDNQGRKFGCSNSDHLQHWVYEGDLAARNSMSGLLPPRRSIAADGGAAEVFRISPDEPWRIIRTRWRIAGTVPGMVEGGGRVSGYFTGATGTTIYRGDAYGPGFINNSFTGDAGGQLVHRKIIRPSGDGVNLSGQRPEDESDREFAASRDTWVRVVNFANAPDGCLHLCDMYREVIEHPWSIPDEIKRHLDLNSGNQRGRIYRIVPEKWVRPRRGDISGVGGEELAKLLSHPNGWHRDTAQRLIYERQDKSAIPALEKAAREGGSLARLHALSALDGLRALREETLTAALTAEDEAVRERGIILATQNNLSVNASPSLLMPLASLADDPNPRVRFALALALGGALEKNASPEIKAALIRLAKRDHSHPWIGPALLSSPPALAARILFEPLSSDPEMRRNGTAFLARLIEMKAATGSPAEREELISFVAANESAGPLFLQSLGDGLRRAGTSLEKADVAGKLSRMFQQAAETASSPSRPINVRIAALETLAFAPAKQGENAALACLAPQQSEALQQAALKSLARAAPASLTNMILPRWPGLGEKARETALDLIMSRPDRIAALLEAIEKNQIPAAALSPSRIQALLGEKDKQISDRARVALAAVIPPSRSEVLAKFQGAVAAPGDASRGQVQFMARCATCHRAAGQGMEVGPDLVTVKNRGRDGLLTAILDPAKEIAAQYILYTVNTKDGETFSGFIAEDSAAGVILKMAGGLEQKLERSRIKAMSSAGHSMMPEGLEAGMSEQDMADLLTFIEELK